MTSPEQPLPAPEKARTGRDLQRYSTDGERLLAGCIPVRKRSAANGVDGVEVLLVSSRGGKGLVFPKGGWETDEDVESAAARETVEEAGVRGKLEVPMLGKFRYMGKPDKQHTAPVKCIIHMFVMHVADELPVWPEMAQRQRFWLSVEEACAKCRHPWMREALQMWLEQRGWSPRQDCSGLEPQTNGVPVAS
ncbi:g12512 [Coccomyxa viridis]|uniref:G12512 protein n=1 Tax=Coccomyxa viridis TaxID=1274662 RepID=A0ABP1GHJ6_9CHLO